MQRCLSPEMPDTTRLMDNDQSSRHFLFFSRPITAGPEVVEGLEYSKDVVIFNLLTTWISYAKIDQIYGF